MPDPDTIRSILERIRDGNDHADKHNNACTHCWTQREAVAAIDLLDNYETVTALDGGEHYLVIPDPKTAAS